LIDWKIIFEMIYNVLSGTLNPTKPVPMPATTAVFLQKKSHLTDGQVRAIKRAYVNIRRQLF